MKSTEEQLALEILSVFAKNPEKSLFRINVLGRSFQEGNLEIQLKEKFSEEERVFAWNIFEKLNKEEFIKRSFDDAMSPEEKFKITNKGLDANTIKSIKLTKKEEIFLEGSDAKDQYQLLNRIGSGGFGDVFNAFDTIQGKIVAIKIYRNDSNLTDAYAKEIWEREAKQALKIHDPNVIESIDFRKSALSDGSEKHFLIMEQAEESLADQITKRRLEGGFFPESHLNQIFTEILNGMKAIHAVAYHRDLKPENILVVKGKYKISDFGLAKYVDETTRTRTFKGWGTTKYMAPESWIEGSMSKATDIYSLGIMFYELATLQLPYSSAEEYEMERLHRFGAIPSIKVSNKNLSSKLEGIVKKMMQKSPGDRYQNVSEIIEDMNRADPTIKVDVSEIVVATKSILEKEEHEKSETLKESARIESGYSVSKYHVEEFIGKIDTIIQNINAETPERKISISKGSGTDYTMTWGDKDLLRVHFNVDIFKSDLVLKGLNISALCNIEYPMVSRDEGQNFILLKNDEDEYGSWKVLEVNANAVTQHIQYPRIVDFKGLRRIAKFGNAMDVLTHEISDDVDGAIKKMLIQAFDFIKNPELPFRLVSDLIILETEDD